MRPINRHYRPRHVPHDSTQSTVRLKNEKRAKTKSTTRRAKRRVLELLSLRDSLHPHVGVAADAVRVIGEQIAVHRLVREKKKEKERKRNKSVVKKREINEMKWKKRKKRKKRRGVFLFHGSKFRLHFPGISHRKCGKLWALGEVTPFASREGGTQFRSFFAFVLLVVAAWGDAYHALAI